LIFFLSILCRVGTWDQPLISIRHPTKCDCGDAMLVLGMVDVSAVGTLGWQRRQVLAAGREPCPSTWFNNEADILFPGIMGASGGVELSRPVTTHIQELGYSNVGFWGNIVPIHCLFRASWGLSMAHCDRPGPLSVPFSTCPRQYMCVLLHLSRIRLFCCC
jgi:hypothetical protein